MVSAVVFGACAAPIVGSIAWVSHHTRAAERRAAIHALLQDQMARLIGKFDSGTGASESTTTIATVLGGTTVTITTSVVPASLMSRRYSVLVKADWTEYPITGDPVARTMSVASRLYNE